MRRTEMRGFEWNHTKSPQVLTSKTICSAREIKGFDVVRGELIKKVRPVFESGLHFYELTSFFPEAVFREALGRTRLGCLSRCP